VSTENTPDHNRSRIKTDHLKQIRTFVTGLITTNHVHK